MFRRINYPWAVKGDTCMAVFPRRSWTGEWELIFRALCHLDGWAAPPAKVIATAVVVFWNFLAHRHWAFSYKSIQDPVNGSPWCGMSFMGKVQSGDRI
jgi:hypothetical protein